MRRYVVVIALVGLAVSAGMAYAKTRGTSVLSSACVHRHGGGLYVGSCAAGDRSVRFGAKVVTASGQTGPVLKPGTYYVSVTANLSHGETHDTMGSCQILLPISPTAPYKVLGTMFLLGAAPSYNVTAPGDWSGAFSMSGVVTVPATTRPVVGCTATGNDQVSYDARWWVVSV